MRIHEQAQKRKEALNQIKEELEHFKISVDRKMRQPYGDGSRDKMVNGETDVLPRIEQLLQMVNDAP